MRFLSGRVTHLLALVVSAGVLSMACDSKSPSGPTGPGPAGSLATITVIPDPDSLMAGSIRTFTAVGRDAQSNVVEVTPQWSVTSGGGVIDAGSGRFTAGNVAGTFANTVNATSGRVSGSASVSVCPCIMDLGTLGGPSSRATAINEAGQVVGSAAIASWDVHPFLWEGGRMRDLGFAGDANSINASGQVVGINSENVHAFLWQQGTLTDLGVLAGDSSWALRINDAGDVLGRIYTSDNVYHAVLWQQGRMIEVAALGTPADFERGHGGGAMGFDAASEVALVLSVPMGSGPPHAFLWQHGTSTDLGTLGGATVAAAISATGAVVGSSNTASEGHAFLWQAGTMIDLGPGQASGINSAGQVLIWEPQGRLVLWDKGMKTYCNGCTYTGLINDAGRVAGRSNDRSSGLYGWVWDGRQVTKLGGLGGEVTAIFGMNSKGWIVGESKTASGELHAALWVVPR